MTAAVPVWLAAGSGVPARCDRITAALADALQNGSIDRICSLREVAAALRRSQPLSREDRLAVDEVLRRGDRCIGLMVRRGQQEGWVRREGLNGRVAGVSPREYLGAGRGMTSAYALADNLTSEQFEGIIAEARAAGDLSRLAVVRRALAQQERPDPQAAGQASRISSGGSKPKVTER